MENAEELNDLKERLESREEQLKCLNVALSEMADELAEVITSRHWLKR